jgi:hypothetical protein
MSAHVCAFLLARETPETLPAFLLPEKTADRCAFYCPKETKKRPAASNRHSTSSTFFDIMPIQV